MTFGIVLNESDLREMPPDLREPLLRWYFDQAGTTADPSSAPVSMIAQTPSRMVPRRTESGRVTFSEFVRAGLLVPGTELVCKALKRQKRDGSEAFFEAGTVRADGSVEYRGRHYAIPSTLAVTVVNHNEGHTQALNGYEYLCFRASDKLVPLRELREQFLNRSP